MSSKPQTSDALQRNIGLFSAVSMMTGCMVGASIFIIPGELSASTGPTAWLSYLIGALLISFSCFMFAQVGAVLPVSGANYILCTGAVNSTWGFLYVWCYLMGNSFLFPIMSKTAATYLSIFFPALAGHIPLVSVAFILLTCGISALGNQASTRVQNACVILLIAIVLIFSAGGIGSADWSHFVPMFPRGVKPVILGVISTYYAFAGVNCIIDLSGEIKDPGKNIPRTVFISLGIVVVMYVSMCVALVGLMPAQALGVAAPAVTAAELIFPRWFSFFIAAAAIAACWTTLNALISAMSRMMFVLGRSGILPKPLSKTNRRNAPYLSISILAVMGVCMVLFSATIMQYVNVSSFYLLLTALLVAVASLRLKGSFAKEYASAAFRLDGVWYYLWPGLAIAASVVFMVLQLTDDPVMTGVAVALVPVGIGVYLLRKKRLEAGGKDVDREIMQEMYR